MKHLLAYLSFLWLILLAGPELAAQELGELLAGNLESRGGRQALESVRSVRMKGRFDMGGLPAAFVMDWKRPDKFRLEIEMQSVKVIQAYDGKNGWTVDPSHGLREPTPLSGDQLVEIVRQSDFDGPLVDSAKKGHRIVLAGRADVGGTEAHKLEVTLKDGHRLTMFLDPETHHLIRQEAPTTVLDEKMTMVISYGDFRKVGEVVLPHVVKQAYDDAPAAMKMMLDEVEWNVEIDDGQFVMPEAAVEG